MEDREVNIMDTENTESSESSQTLDDIQAIIKPDGSKFRILVVDDSLFQRKVIRKIIEKMNCEVVGEAPDGIDAVEMYKELKPDLVTLDITMPGCNGYVALQKILAVDTSAVVVMVTALSHDKIVHDCLDAGAKKFITKPFKPCVVAFTLTILLKNHYKAEFV